MFPIRDTIPSRRPPVATWLVIAANIAVFVYQLTLPEDHLDQMVYLFGIVPRRFTHPWWAAEVGFPTGVYWPFVSSMFLHGGFLHLITNMWTLWIFGDNVEDRMGFFRFLLFYLLCGVFSGFVHTVTNFGSPVPAIGASGAIAGVLAAYWLMYPFARVICLVPIFFIPLFIPIPAFIFVLFWFIMQFFSGTLSLLSPGHGGGIAWWAHIGGFLGGLAIHKWFVKYQPPPRYADREPRTIVVQRRRW